MKGSVKLLDCMMTILPERLRASSRTSMSMIHSCKLVCLCSEMPLRELHSRTIYTPLTAPKVSAKQTTNEFRCRRSLSPPHCSVSSCQRAEDNWYWPIPQARSTSHIIPLQAFHHETSPSKYGPKLQQKWQTCLSNNPDSPSYPFRSLLVYSLPAPPSSADPLLRMWTLREP